MKVIEKTEYEGFMLYELSHDIVTGDIEKTFGLIVVDDRVYHLSEDEMKWLKAQNIEVKTFREQVKRFQQLLVFPLKNGQMYGYNQEDIQKREDGCYVWYVSDEIKEAERYPGEVIGEKDYKIEFRTVPDRYTLHFLWGYGIGAFEYFHNGTPTNWKAVLKSVE